MQWAKQSIKNILEDVSNLNLAYTIHNDICSVFPGETLLAIKVSFVIEPPLSLDTIIPGSWRNPARGSQTGVAGGSGAEIPDPSQIGVGADLRHFDQQGAEQRASGRPG